MEANDSSQDIEFIRAFCAGDQHAFRQFYAKYADRLYRYILGSCGTSAMADEIAAQAWEKFLGKIDTINQTPAAYLFAIARHLIIDSYRLPKHLHGVPLTVENEPVISGQLEEDADLQLLLSHLQVLPAKQRDALLLKHYAGYSIDEIASLQGVARESIKSRLRYAVAKTRRLFRQEPV